MLHIKTFSPPKLQKKYQICKRKVHFYAKNEEKSGKFNEKRDLGRENGGKNISGSESLVRIQIGRNKRNRR